MPCVSHSFLSGASHHSNIYFMRAFPNAPKFVERHIEGKRASMCLYKRIWNRLYLQTHQIYRNIQHTIYIIYRMCPHAVDKVNLFRIFSLISLTEAIFYCVLFSLKSILLNSSAGNGVYLVIQFHYSTTFIYILFFLFFLLLFLLLPSLRSSSHLYNAVSYFPSVPLP